MRKRRTRRRGALLLVMLSLLVLFLLVAVTFVLVTRTYRGGAEAFARIETTGTDARKELDDAIFWVLVGTDADINPGDSVAQRSTKINNRQPALAEPLLEDLYGLDWVRGTVNGSPSPAMGGQFLTLNISAQGGTLSQIPEFYNGRVITFLNGAAGGLSSRIVRYLRSNSGFMFVVETPKNRWNGPVLPVVRPGEPGPVQVVINGAPYGGGSRSAGGTTIQIDDDYDYPDHNNTFLSNDPPEGHGMSSGNSGRPSYFNLPPVVGGAGIVVDNDGNNKRDSRWIDVGFGVKAVQGPKAKLTEEQKTYYKPHIAVKVVDLCGLLNLNAHSNRWHLTSHYSSGTSNPYAVRGAGSVTERALEMIKGMGNGPPDIDLAFTLAPQLRTSGGGTSPENTALGRILRARYGADGHGNLGVPGLSGTADPYGQTAAYGTWTDDPLSVLKSVGMPQVYQFMPGQEANFPLGIYGSPPDMFGRQSVGVDQFGRPLYAWDLLQFDLRDDLTGGVGSRERWDDPYEMDLSLDAARYIRAAIDMGRPPDAPFTVAELEALLRYYDRDRALLPSRLLQRDVSVSAFLGDHDTAVRNRSIFTTHSFDIPSLTAPWPDLLAQLIAQNNEWMYLMLAPEMLFGRKMDLNRLFGNGRDDQASQGNVPGRYVVDEPGEETWAAPKSVWPNMRLDDPNGSYKNALANLWNDARKIGSGGGVEPARGPQDIRQVYARQLYCLMLAAARIDDTTDDVAARRRKRQIAQWAINAVDFRDSDAIMSPFEFDYFPFDGWHVDGNLETNQDRDRPHSAQGSSGAAPTGGIVWGMEYHDLLLSEALAFHDRRVKDTSADDDHPLFKLEDKPGGRGGEDAEKILKLEDDDLDQHRVPQGSLFLELFCNGSNYRSNPNPPLELYSYDTQGGVTDVALDLGRMSPPDGNGIRYPVWQVGISQSHEEYGGPHQETLREHFFGHGYDERTELLPQDSSTSPAAGAMVMTPGVDDVIRLTPYPDALQPGHDATLRLERFIWFAPVRPGRSGDASAHPFANRIYFNRSFTEGSSVLLRPGRYAVVGPRDKTHLGSQAVATTGGGSNVTPSKQTIELTYNSISGTNLSGSDAYAGVAGTVQPIVGIVAAADLSYTGWTGEKSAIVTSNVAGGDDTWAKGIGISVSEPLPASYYPEPTFEMTGAPTTLGGQIITDGYSADDTGTYKPYDLPFEKGSGSDGRPLNQHERLTLTGTHGDYKTAVLQRLANPLLPWHRYTNPYISVDWATIDLTVFNGDHDSRDYLAAIEQAVEYLDKEDNPIAEEDLPPFDAEDDPEDPANTNMLPEEPAGARQRGADALAADDESMIWTYGAAPLEDLTSGGDSNYFPFDYNTTSPRKHTLGYLNNTYRAGGALVTRTTGGGGVLSAYYNGAPSRAFPWLTWHNRPFVSAMELMMVPKSAPSRLNYEFTTAASAGGFGHLLNFYDTSRGYYRIFDYVDVPSRFVGTETWYNPGSSSGFGNVSQTLGSFLRPPFNCFSRYRDPGKVNINTFNHWRIWQAIRRIPESRSNDAKNEAQAIAASRKSKPFRSFRHGRDRSIMRADGNQKLISTYFPGSQSAHVDPERHAFFEMDGINRVHNLLTTKSSVFAVWITLGYFEVTKDFENQNAGWQVVRELGSDTGDVKRHRAFFIVDRSVPVAYEAGKRHNVDKCILLKRFIE